MTTGHFIASDSKCEEEMETQQWQVSSAQFCIGNLGAPKKITRHASLVHILLLADTQTSNQNIKLRLMCFTTLGHKNVHKP